MTPKQLIALKNEAYTNNFEEVPVGAGYYALRRTKSKGNKGYTKLVQRDRSPSGTIHVMIRRGGVKLTPSVGHNARRQHILDKHANKLMVKGA